MTVGCYFEAELSLRQKIWRRLGFGWARAPRTEIDEMSPEWAPSWFVVDCTIKFDWKDWLRLLVSRSVHIEHAIKTDVKIGRSEAVTAVRVIPPGMSRG